MALTGTDRGGNNATGVGTTIACAPTSTLPAGSLGVLKVAYDNSVTGGADPYSSIAVDTAGNVWVARQNALADPGAASAGCTFRIFTAVITTQLTSAGSVTITFGATGGGSVAYVFESWTSDVGTADYKTGGVTNNGSGTAFTMTTASITIGDGVSCGVAIEQRGTPGADDTDTTNGSWSTGQTALADTGTGTTSMGTRSQRKIVTATGTQTWNFTVANTDWCAAYIVISETVTLDAKGTAASSATGSLTTTRPLSATGAAAASATASLAAARPLVSKGVAAASVTAALTVTGGGAPVVLDGAGSSAASATGSLTAGLITICSDSFNRADATLSGVTLDNAGGGAHSHTWTVKTGTWSVVSNQAKQTVGSVEPIIVVGSTPAVDIQRVTITCAGSTKDHGVIARWQAGATADGKFYVAYRGGDGKLRLYRGNGNGSFTQLGSDGDTVADGDTITIDCRGSSIRAYRNGVLKIGPITDATYTTGLPGIYGGGLANSIRDDFVYLSTSPGVVLDAKATSSASASGNAGVARPIAATGKAAASSTATLSTTRPIAATAPASASARASLATSRPLTASGSAAASATGTLSDARSLAATPSAAASSSGTLTIARPLAATSSASASASGAVAAARPLSASGAAAASASGTMAVARELHSAPSASAGATGTLTEARTLQATASAASTSTSALSLTRALQASSSASGSASGALDTTRPTSGNAPASSDARGTLTRAVGLESVAPAASTPTAELTIASAINLAGTASTSATAQAALSVLRALIASSPASGAATGTTTLIRPLEGTASAAATARGDWLQTRLLIALAAAAADAFGDLTVTGRPRRREHFRPKDLTPDPGGYEIWPAPDGAVGY